MTTWTPGDPVHDVPVEWWCPRCSTAHRHGNPLTDRCDCGFLQDEDPR